MNVPRFFIRHRFALAEITRIRSPLDQADGTWIVVRALNGAAGAVASRPRITRHLSAPPGLQAQATSQRRSDLFKRDASFIVRPALNGLPGAFSFESVNFPGFYIRHSNYQLWINRSDGSDLYARTPLSVRAQTAFRPTPLLPSSR